MIFSYRIDGCQITDIDKNLIEAKLQKLEKFDVRITDESVKAHINVLRGTRHNSPNYKISIQLTIPRESLRAEASGKTIADAVDEIEREFRVQIEKLK